MIPLSGDPSPVLPAEVDAYLTSHLGRIVNAMRTKIVKVPEETLYWVTIEMLCPRPQGMSRDQLVRCLEYHLSQRLEAFENATFAAHVYINGVTDEKRYHIRWQPAAAVAHEETDRD